MDTTDEAKEIAARLLALWKGVGRVSLLLFVLLVLSKTIPFLEDINFMWTVLSLEVLVFLAYLYEMRKLKKNPNFKEGLRLTKKVNLKQIHEALDSANTKLCPKCAERIKSAAVLCKHCGSSI